MIVSTRIKLTLALWFAGEAVVFVLVAHAIGFPEALLLTFITTLFGWTLLKRAGASAMIKLRATLDGRVAPGSRHFLDETLATVGALALLMPGFLSDLVGLFLAVPSARDRVSLWIGKRGWIAKGGLSGLQPSDTRVRPSPSSIDLDPDDWRRTDGPQRPITKS